VGAGAAASTAAGGHESRPYAAAGPSRPTTPRRRCPGLRASRR